MSATGSKFVPGSTSLSSKPKTDLPLSEMKKDAGALSPETGHGREFEYTPADFEQIRKLIYDHAGIVLSSTRQDMVYSRLARRLRVYNDRSFARYLERVRKGNSEWEFFVNALTTNLTSFFREEHHFVTLAEEFKRLAAEKSQIKVWCCAASTGEEPYSIAMVACEAFNSLTPPVQIFASDIDTSVLKQAAAGVYPPDRMTGVSLARRQKFFLPSPADGEGMMKIKPELQRLIRFSPINLLDARWPFIPSGIDIIFCRNVLIYFDKNTQLEILKKFAPLLTPKGLLFAGHSENLMHAAALFRSRGRTVYERVNN